MPTYTIRDPSSGKTISVKGESPPSESELNDIFSSVSGGPDWKGVVGSAVKEAGMRPGTMTRSLATNPVTQAKALPYLAQTAGTAMMPWGGGTTGYAAGRGLSDLALKTYGKGEEIPSKTQQGLELGGAVLGDITAIPALKKAAYGKQIGKIEEAQGVPKALDIESSPMNLGQKSLGEYVNDTVRSVKDSGGKGAPEYWLRMKDQVDRIYKLGKDAGLTSLDQRRLAAISKQIEEGLNTSVPGRAIPAKAMGQALTPWRAMRNVNKAIPAKYKIAGLGAGALGGTIEAGEFIKKLLLGG